MVLKAFKKIRFSEPYFFTYFLLVLLDLFGFMVYHIHWLNKNQEGGFNNEI